jgi:hypothetical protein
MKRRRRRKCRHCGELFHPDPRNQYHQKYCSEPACRRASKTASQKRWLAKSHNLTISADRPMWRVCAPGVRPIGGTGAVRPQKYPVRYKHTATRNRLIPLRKQLP